MRLDQGLSLFLNCSRSAAAGMIRHDIVSHPDITLKPSLIVTENFFSELIWKSKYFSMGQLKLNHCWSKMPATVASLDSFLEQNPKSIHFDVGTSAGKY